MGHLAHMQTLISLQSCCLPLFENECSCKTLYMKWLEFQENERTGDMHFHSNSFAQRLILPQRQKSTIHPWAGSGGLWFSSCIINNSLCLAWKHAWIFVPGHYLIREANCSERVAQGKLWMYEEQIIPKDKYPSLYLCQIEMIVIINQPSTIFRCTHSFENWGI